MKVRGGVKSPAIPHTVPRKIFFNLFLIFKPVGLFPGTRDLHTSPAGPLINQYPAGGDSRLRRHHKHPLWEADAHLSNSHTIRLFLQGTKIRRSRPKISGRRASPPVFYAPLPLSSSLSRETHTYPRTPHTPSSALSISPSPTESVGGRKAASTPPLSRESSGWDHHANQRCTSISPRPRDLVGEGGLPRSNGNSRSFVLRGSWIVSAARWKQT